MHFKKKNLLPLFVSWLTSTHNLSAVVPREGCMVKMLSSEGRIMELLRDENKINKAQDR